MIDLKVVCTICGKEESNKSLIKDISDNICKYKLNSEHYLDFLNLMSERCLDSYEHSFVFDDEFVEELKKIVKLYKELLDNKELLISDKLINDKAIENAEIKLMELKTIKDVHINKIKNVDKHIDKLEYSFSESTGSDNIEKWFNLIKTEEKVE